MQVSVLFNDKNMVVYFGHHTSQKWTNGQRFPLQSLRRLILHIHSCANLKVKSFLDCVNFFDRIWPKIRFDHDIDFAPLLQDCFKFNSFTARLTLHSFSATPKVPS